MRGLILLLNILEAAVCHEGTPDPTNLKDKTKSGDALSKVSGHARFNADHFWSTTWKGGLQGLLTGLSPLLYTSG